MDRDWQHWIDRLKSDDLTEAELREFHAAVDAAPGNRDAYLSALLAEVALEAGGLPDPFAQAAVISLPARRWPRIAAMAAGIAAMAAACYFAGSRGGPPAFVATVTDADELAEKAGLRIGQPLEKGSVALPEGSEIGIAMRGGARLKIKGPANLEIDGPDRIRLDKGRVSTYAPPYAHGFTVDTVDGKVIDLGTRFVTAAGAGSGTEIHVLEGLVEAHAGTGAPEAHSLTGQRAGILKDGLLKPTEFLAQRLLVPLDPVLPDQDGDGVPDAVENYYGTRTGDASSRPAPLRIEESVAGYPPGPIRGSALKSGGGGWEGTGTFGAEGLSFPSLKTSGGAVHTTGETFVGAILRPEPGELSPAGVTYVSFLMQNLPTKPSGCFSGLMFYQADREEFFVGKLSVADSYGSRLKQSNSQDAFGIRMDAEPHLFVIRIDRTRLVTDVFIDPVPGQPESAATRRFRYQDVPEFDRIVLRSGSGSGAFPTRFDEIRLGMTWESVVPVAD